MDGRISSQRLWGAMCTKCALEAGLRYSYNRTTTSMSRCRTLAVQSLCASICLRRYLWTRQQAGKPSERQAYLPHLPLFHSSNEGISCASQVAIVNSFKKSNHGSSSQTAANVAISSGTHPNSSPKQASQQPPAVRRCSGLAVSLLPQGHEMRMLFALEKVLYLKPHSHARSLPTKEQLH